MAKGKQTGSLWNFTKKALFVGAIGILAINYFNTRRDVDILKEQIGEAAYQDSVGRAIEIEELDERLTKVENQVQSDEKGKQAFEKRLEKIVELTMGGKTAKQAVKRTKKKAKNGAITLADKTVKNLAFKSISDNVYTKMAIVDVITELYKQYRNSTKIANGDSIAVTGKSLQKSLRGLRTIYLNKGINPHVNLSKVERILLFDRYYKGQKRKAFKAELSKSLNQKIPDGWGFYVRMSYQSIEGYLDHDEKNPDNITLTLRTAGVELVPPEITSIKSALARKMPFKGVDFTLNVGFIKLRREGKEYIAKVYGVTKDKKKEQRWVEYNITSCSKRSIHKGYWRIGKRGKIIET